MNRYQKGKLAQWGYAALSGFGLFLAGFTAVTTLAKENNNTPDWDYKWTAIACGLLAAKKFFNMPGEQIYTNIAKEDDEVEGDEDEYHEFKDSDLVDVACSTKLTISHTACITAVAALDMTVLYFLANSAELTIKNLLNQDISLATNHYANKQNTAIYYFLGDFWMMLLTTGSIINERLRNWHYPKNEEKEDTTQQYRMGYLQYLVMRFLRIPCIKKIAVRCAKPSFVWHALLHSMEELAATILAMPTTWGYWPVIGTTAVCTPTVGLAIFKQTKGFEVKFEAQNLAFVLGLPTADTISCGLSQSQLKCTERLLPASEVGHSVAAGLPAIFMSNELLPPNTTASILIKAGIFTALFANEFALGQRCAESLEVRHDIAIERKKLQDQYTITLSNTNTGEGTDTDTTATPPTVVVCNATSPSDEDRTEGSEVKDDAHQHAEGEQPLTERSRLLPQPQPNYGSVKPPPNNHKDGQPKKRSCFESCSIM